jgi:hypothetical protein
MICTNAATPIFGISGFCGTRHDFVEALAQLGAKVELQGSRGVETALRRVRLTCPMSAWVSVFGQPATMAQQHGPRGTLVFQAWQYQCGDGSVLCLGRMGEQADGTCWITLWAIHLADE